jgi:copper oxidase (laccase) domain-containing protein
MLQARSLGKLTGIRHGFFDRTGGVSQGHYASLNGGVGSDDAPDKVAENRSRMAAALGVSAGRFLTPYQIHSPDVVTVEAPWTTPDTRPRADALVTRTPSLAIGVSTADCGPLLFADAQARVIGAAHAGWRGAFTGVIEATVAAMEKLGADRGRIAAALGPTISQANYVASEREGHAMFDLNGYIAARIAQAGIANFEDVGLCTYAEPALFYSYRRSTHRSEPDYGRHINAIALAE